MKKRKSKRLLNNLNKALSVAESQEEYAVRQKIKKLFAKIVLKEQTDH